MTAHKIDPEIAERLASELDALAELAIEMREGADELDFKIQSIRSLLERVGNEDAI